MKSLLIKLEEELQEKSIFCSYTIARSLFGMNAFHQLAIRIQEDWRTIATFLIS